MATLTTADPRSDVAPDVRGQRRSTLLFWFGMPAFLVTVWVATYLVISSRELDSIEQRTLNYSQLRDSVVEHLQLTVVSTIVVILLAIPLGVIATRPFARRAVPGILGVANIGQGVPSYGLLAIVVVLWTVGFWPVVIGLVAYSALPIVRNTMVGLQQVDRSLIKASRGMGMSAVHVLFRVELPLAIPVMIAGIRTALILNVGTATLATFFAGGGLGYIIFNGIQLNRSPVLYAGVIMVSSLALLVDYLGKAAGRLLAPKGL
ncbi:ABC transporter permease [Rhodococcus antarcticus]|jgi:osmoprotectant transport system permease protein|uniref:ABC transporter permease n=1 Tax=Rhodococcus antarcticus TaxID=2987751 RepID=A0ABY6NY39_9NOCA|nr:ABC transporter permease [Rhodococcus antarcticus]UZJ24314.1 ABC transporter permease [Rhodococcus antarcticus]